MATFPDIVGAPSGYQRSSAYTVRRSQFSADAAGLPHHVRYRKSLRPRYAFSLTWDHLTEAQAREIIDFAASVEGGELTFDWFDWKPQYWTHVPVATGDGSTVTFDIPAKESLDHEFRVDGVTVVGGTVALGAGADGRDRVTLNSPVPADRPLTVHFYGRRQFTVSYDDIGELIPNATSNTYSYSASLISSK